MKHERDRRTKKEQGALLGRGGEVIPFRTDASFWDEERNPQDRVTLIVEVETDEDLGFQADGCFDVRVGRPAKHVADAQGPLVHAAAHAMFPTATPRRWQLEMTVMETHAPEPPLTPETVAPKQWIVLRKDLGMRKGKMVAQGGHGVLKVFLEQMVRGPEEGKFTLYASDAVLAWLEGKFTKICLGARNEEELLEVYEKSRETGVMCTLITDAGLTEFDGVPTNTCVVVGPAYPHQVEPFTKHLPLL